MTDAQPTCTRCGEPWAGNDHVCNVELVARLRELLREVLAQGIEHETRDYAVVQMDHTLMVDIQDELEKARP